MQIKKEECAGSLYLMSMYSAGVLPRHKPRERAIRKQVMSEGKRKINAVRRKFGLMLQVSENFESGRDLFVYLGWEHEPTDAEDKNALRTFHRRMGALYKKLGIAYRYIGVTETHTRDGEPCRKHHHLVLSGTGRRMMGKIMQCWGRGSVDVRVLRELTDNFEDTCRYLLKEKKEKGARAFQCSQNLCKAQDPMRRKVPETECGEVPPGVKVVKYDVRDTDFGRYEILVGKIVDKLAFDNYWERARADKRRLDERHYWRSQCAKRERRAKMQGGIPPAMQEMESNI